MANASRPSRSIQMPEAGPESGIAFPPRDLLPFPRPFDEESRWSFALNAARQGVWDHDLVRGKAFFSSMWREIRGFGPNEDVDAEMGPWIERLHPEDRDRIRATTTLQDRGQIKENAIEYRERHRNGHWIWILSRGRPVEWLPDGTVARIMGTDTDITSLKKIESELAEEKERLKITLQSIAEGMISTDATGLITFVNPAAETMTGLALAQALGRPLGDVLRLSNGSGADLTVGTLAQCIGEAKTVLLGDDTLLFGKAGAPRFIQLSASPVITPAAGLMGTVFVFRDATESRELKQRLQHSATHDALTGLPNRVAFETALNQAVDSAQREHREHCLCFIDLDRFKQVNDGAGHPAGDKVLETVGACLRRTLRSNDLAARVGGDEFTVLLIDCNLANGRRVAQKIVDAVGALHFSFEGKDYRIGASVGVTTITRKPISKAVFIGEADAACYAAKSAGRGQVAVFSEPMERPRIKGEQIALSKP